MNDLERLTRADGETLAVKRVRGSGPTVVWIGGFRSDMEGTKALALDAAAPVHILQGRADDVVPWRRQIALVERLTGADVRLDLIEGGDHRLSTPADLARLVDAVERNRRSSSTLS